MSLKEEYPEELLKLILPGLSPAKEKRGQREGSNMNRQINSMRTMKETSSQ